jgi:dTDP-4-amino-4,6-dideoxygalactose transaminase
MDHMNKEGISTSQVHNKNDGYSIFEDFKDDKLTGVEYFSSRNVSIPVGWWVSEEELEHIAKAINSWK